MMYVVEISEQADGDVRCMPDRSLGARSAVLFVVRACLKNHSRSLHTPVLAKFFSDSVSVARYASFI